MERKPFLLRLDPATMEALRVWAGDDLRSLNGQIEFLLRRALRDSGRLPKAKGRGPGSPKHRANRRRLFDTRARGRCAGGNMSP